MNPSTVVSTPKGVVRGLALDGYTRFSGIPFAKPPVGEMRFAPPVEPEPWPEILDATQFKKNPFQASDQYDPEVFGDDSLYLNVWVPDHYPDERLPVLTWVYGGSYATGGTGRTQAGVDTTSTDAALLANQTQSIVVTFNYRLNLTGFLGLHEFAPEYGSNNGLRDQISALKWISENIGAFGGDASNVTLFGESAGASSILALMSIPAADPYFQRAIAQSPPINAVLTAERSAEIARDYLKLVGVPEDDLSRLTELDPEEIIAANRVIERQVSTESFITELAFGPTIDGVLLTGPPAVLAAQSQKPLIIGTNNDEAFLFTFFLSDEEIQKNAARAPFDLAVYPGDIRQQAGRGLTDYMFKDPIRMFARTKAIRSPVYVYNLEYAPVVARLFGVGSAHALDVPILFGQTRDPGIGLFSGSRDSADRVGRDMRNSWGEFARSGTLTYETWRPFKSDEDIRSFS